MPCHSSAGFYANLEEGEPKPELVFGGDIPSIQPENETLGTDGGEATLSRFFFFIFIAEASSASRSQTDGLTRLL